MSAKAAADDPCNTETEEGTVALQKKRSRRVSFAEITSVHVFDRDDEYETPPEPRPSSENEDDLGFLRFLADGEESSQNEEKVEGNEEDDELEDGRRSFFRPFESPSPGSTIGSATSNDEDNFFGPVSASFIQHGRFSDSAASDENHDITLDSTAFSMHFRSLARSDSGGDLKTPTGVHLSFEEKTPTQNTVPANVGSSMVLTVAKPISESSTSVDKLSGSRYSNDMSLVGESPQRYDYGRLSPGLDALLAEGSKDLHAVSVLDNIPFSESSIKLKNRSSPSKKQSGLIEPVDGREKEMGSIDSAELDDANGGCNVSPLGKITSGLSDMRNTPASDVSVDKQCWSPNQLTEGLTCAKTKDSDALEIRRPNSDCDAAICESQSYLDNKAQRTDVFASSGYETPPAPALSSLSAKQRLIVLNNDSPLQNLQITTPFENQQSSFVRDLTRKQSEIVSSIQKSISKLKMINASPFSSSLKVNNGSTLIPLDIFKSTVYNTVLDRDREDVQMECVDTAVACSEDRLFIVATENGELKSSIDMDASDIETVENKVDVSHAKSSLGVAEDGISPGHISSGFFPKLKEEEGLLSQITWSGNKMRKNLLTPGDPIEGMVFTSAEDSSFMEIMLDSSNNKKTTGTPHRTLPSSEKIMEKASIVSEKYRAQDRRPYDQVSKSADVNPGRDADSRDNVRNASPFTINKLDSLFLDTALSSSPIMEINHPKESIRLESMDDIGNFQTPLSDKDTKEVHSMIVNGNLDVDKPVRLKELTMGGVKVSSLGSASPFVHRGGIELQSQKFNMQQVVKLVTQSPSRKENHNAAHNDKLHSVMVEGILSPNSNYLTDSFGNFYERKRRREDTIPGNSALLDEISRIRRSPKHHRSEVVSESFSEQPSESSTETSTVGRDGEARVQHWADVFSKFLADAKQLFSPSTDKLNLPAIAVLEDVLVNLRRVQIYETLCSEVRSQKLSHNFSNPQYKRIAETKLLLHRFVHEQAKLQLMKKKRERLMKKLQLLSSGIQESQMLKLKFLPHLSVLCTRDACVESVDNNHRQSVNFEGTEEEEVSGDKVTALRQVLDDSERKVMSLCKSFLNSSKKQGQTNSADTILFVSDQLKKKACCRFIRLDMQLWDVDNLESANDHHNIVLNYLGFIIQRFTINVGPVSRIVISNKPNDVNFSKSFPNMDVCTAFAFVLNASTTRKYVGSISLTQETQITSSVLGNLLDVVQEVQAASVELQNLTCTSFRSTSVEQLELHLHFIDFNSGRRAVLSIDMSCLKWGIYPSDAVPAVPPQLEGPPDVSRKLLPEPQLAEIRAAVQSLRVGYSRIIRLCRCVSELVQTWSG